MIKYLKYVVPFFLIAPCYEAGSADVPVTNSEIAAPSPTDNAGAIPDGTSMPTFPYPPVPSEESTYPPVPPKTMDATPAAPSYHAPSYHAHSSESQQPLSDGHGQETVAKKHAEILAQHEAILERTSQDLTDIKAKLRTLRTQIAKENATSTQKTEEQTELSRDVIPPQAADLPTVSTKPFQNERHPSQIEPNKLSNPNMGNPSTYTTVDEHGDVLGHEEALAGQMEHYQRANNKKINEVRSEVITENPGKTFTMQENSSLYIVP